MIVSYHIDNDQDGDLRRREDVRSVGRGQRQVPQARSQAIVTVHQSDQVPSFGVAQHASLRHV